VKGGGEIVTGIEQKFGIRPGDTTPDGQISVMAARCIGACGIAPAVVFDGTVAGKQTPEMAIARLEKYQNTDDT
jgi:bidirectional [NiFe] hydrogenase diaphorase subunit